MKKIFNRIKNKYFATAIGLVIWVVFFDKNDLRTIFKLNKEIVRLEEERNYYKEQTSEINTKLKELINNPQALEKFARENYLMKRDEENIFIIEVVKS